MIDPPQVPGQDGAGVVDAVGIGVDAALVGQRVWIWEAAFRRAEGTTQEFAVVPASHVVRLPAEASFDLGACLGIPFLTAHRCLTVTEDGPSRLGPGTLQDRVVLVAGGAGAVGNAAIQLARWSDATVISTVSSPAKAQAAVAAGADHVIDYRRQDVVAEVRKLAPNGVNTIVEVSPAANAGIDAAVIARHGSVAMYADDGGERGDRAGPQPDDAERPLAVRARLHRAQAGEGERGRRRCRGGARRGDPGGRGRRPAAAPFPARGRRGARTRPSRPRSSARC